MKDWGVPIEGGFFHEGRHLYRTQDGTVIPSTTQIFDLLGMSDFSSVPADVLEWKRHYGSAVHKGAELAVYDRLDWDSVDEQVIPAITGVEHFLKAVQYQPEAVEERRIATVNGMPFGMTLDHRGSLIYKGQRRSAVIDLKTGLKFSATWNWQIGAYVRGLGKPKFGPWVGLVVQVSKDGRVVGHWIDPVRYGQEFVMLLAVANLMLNNGLGKIRGVEED